MNTLFLAATRNDIAGDPGYYVRRQTIEDFAETVGAARVVTVSSPAGFGKTTAMLRWAELLQEQGRPILWMAAPGKTPTWSRPFSFDEVAPPLAI